MKPLDVKSRIYIYLNKENNTESPKFNVCDHVGISKYQNIFAKDYVLIWSEEVFVITKAKDTVRWRYVSSNLNGEEIVGTFFSEKELQKTSEKEFRIEKVIKRKGDNLYVKWKSYITSFKSWIDKKYII